MIKNMHIDSNALDMLSECVIIVNDMPVHRHKDTAETVILLWDR